MRAATTEVVPVRIRPLSGVRKFGVQGVRASAWTVIGAACAQIVTAGFGLFALERLPIGEASSLDAHRLLGYASEVVGVVLVVLLIVGRPAGRAVGAGLALFLAMLVQPVLQKHGTGIPLLGALHAANALVMVALAWLTVRVTTAQLREAASVEAASALFAKSGR
ncbi:hypothetical protein ACIQRW_02615 [Streptomyces sp. NPDC091287]|uniref:hypothetical protein n=1 Tax=Streptomyces sp. NPDC091287 TaxID=3365988 RepID=UPI0038024A44